MCECETCEELKARLPEIWKATAEQGSKPAASMLHPGKCEINPFYRKAHTETDAPANRGFPPRPTGA